MTADKKIPGGPPVRRGRRTVPSIREVYKGVQFRSRLEVLFAQELEKRQIRWVYEPERIGGGRYLVDFYLPDLKCWVEVKGRFEPRDDLLLPNAAGHLKTERGERLFLYMRSRAYRITWKGFEPLTHEAFWQAVQEPPPDDADLLHPKRRQGDPP
jgi:hypothetical protein